MYKQALMVGIAYLCSVARAQTDSSQSEPLVNSKDVLAEIMVTAQRRTESVLDIPYNLSVLSLSELQNAGGADLNTLARLVPGLFTVDSGPAQRGNNNNLTLRVQSKNSTGRVRLVRCA
jgi:iron complex outermembrane receptor protein